MNGFFTLNKVENKCHIYWILFLIDNKKHVVTIEQKEGAQNLESEDDPSVSAFMVWTFLSQSDKMIVKKPVI